MKYDRDKQISWSNRDKAEVGKEYYFADREKDIADAVETGDYKLVGRLLLPPVDKMFPFKAKTGGRGGTGLVLPWMLIYPVEKDYPVEKEKASYEVRQSMFLKNKRIHGKKLL